MGFSGIGPGSLLLILLIVVVLFGPKRLRGVAEEMGKALKSFRQGMGDENQSSDKTPSEQKSSDQ